MRLFLYEWVTGGGMVDHHGPLPESLAREGRAMAQSVAADAAAAGCSVAMLREMRFPTLVGHGAELIDVDSRASHDAVFDRLAQGADATLLIAPETDAALSQLADRASQCGAKLLSPGPPFVAVASDKQATAERLTAAGVAVPEGRRLEPGESLPADFPYPAVVKPIDGAGSQDTHAVAGPHDAPPAYAWPRRLERFVPGVAASVAVIGAAGNGMAVLEPCRQRLADDGRFGYLGGSTPLARGLADRARRLARRAVAALPSLVGYAGVDLMLGDAPDGSRDAVIEINPRLTTSYVGLRTAARGNLVATMIEAAEGNVPTVEFDTRPLAFDADGAVYWRE